MPFYPDILLDSIAQSLAAHGHTVAPFGTSNRYYATQCTDCATVYYISRYSGVHSASIREPQPCTHAASIADREHAATVADQLAFSAILADVLNNGARGAYGAHALPTPTPQPCAYCGNGSTIVGRGCARCMQREHAPLNTRHHNRLPEYIRHDYIHMRRMHTEYAPARTSTSTPTRAAMVAPCGSECTEYAVYIDRSLHTADDLARAVPLLVFNCAHQCRSYTVPSAQWYNPR
jgi:hypothetical protein